MLLEKVIQDHEIFTSHVEKLGNCSVLRNKMNADDPKFNRSVDVISNRYKYLKPGIVQLKTVLEHSMVLQGGIIILIHHFSLEKLEVK